MAGSAYEPKTDRWGLDVEASKALAGARVPDNGLCWWCRTRPATTAEHKYKATDLRRMADQSQTGVPDPSTLYRSGATYSGLLKSIGKGSAVRWSKSMCSTCNGHRDRFMDADYDAFSEFVWHQQDRLAKPQELDWSDIFPRDWQEHARNVGRYFAKQTGCLFAQQQLPVPKAITDFMNGDDGATNFVFSILRERGRRTGHFISQRQGLDMRGYWLPPISAAVSQDGSRVVSLQSQRFIGFIGVEIAFGEGLHHPSFFDQNPAPIWDVTGLSPWRVRALMARGRVRRLGRRLVGRDDPPL